MSVQVKRFKFLNSDVHELNFDASEKMKEMLPKNDVEDILNVFSTAIQELHSLISELKLRRKLKKNYQNLLQVQSTAFQKLSLLKEEHQKREEEKKDDSELKVLRRKDLTLYERNLRLIITPHYTTSEYEDAVSFIFHDINEKKPQEFCELVLATDGTKYRVTSCIPLVDGLDELIANLNKTNDISLFILKVRRKAFRISSEIH